ncbi:hypothetical protein MBT84_47735 [Streptomyces sp. MBT84]|nr:hypothetical protein [Streptomyces sp. MBT84]
MLRVSDTGPDIPADALRMASIATTSTGFPYLVLSVGFRGRLFGR